MIKISRLADYAVVVLTALTAEQDRLMTAGAVSGKTRLPEPTVAKVLKLLAKGGVVHSIRGASGGYRLSRRATQINMAEIITAIEGPVSITACVEGNPETCNFVSHCPVKGRWDDVNMAIRVALESVTLADMMVERTLPKPVKETEIHERL